MLHVMTLRGFQKMDFQDLQPAVVVVTPLPPKSPAGTQQPATLASGCEHT